MPIPENDTQLWKGFNGHGLYSKRAERDVEGNVIDQTYAKKTDVPALDNSLSDSTTTAVTPRAVKEAVEEVDVIPALPEGPASLYSETAGSMMWGGWESENIDVPETTITIAGQEYKIVQIGNQMWMAENLNYLGNLNFPHTAKPQYESATYPLYVGEYITRFGYLYNSLALDTLESLAPAGWHLPTTDDVSTLESYVYANLANTGAANVADALKSSLNTDWYSSYAGKDVYGFKADAPGYYWRRKYNQTSNYVNYMESARYWCKYGTYDATPYFGINQNSSNSLGLQMDGYYLDYFAVRFVKNLS